MVDVIEKKSISSGVKESTFLFILLNESNR